MSQKPTLLSSKLREARIRSGLTQSQLADKMGVASMYVSMLETGHRRNPSLDVLRKWAIACGTTLTKML